MGQVKGQKIEPRKLAPLYVKDGQGCIDCNLLERVSLEEELPPLGQDGKGGEALGTRLRRNKTWLKFKKQAEKLKEELVPYMPLDIGSQKQPPNVLQSQDYL